MNKRYKKSIEFFKRAKKVIPLGSQTFSKSYLTFPFKHSPLFLSHGRGGHVWDVDGNKYIDFINGLLPNILGYNDKDVIRAVKKVLPDGPTLSLASEHEILLAEDLIEIIPCAEMVRFGKNGTDVTSAAIRLSRSFTEKKRIAVCGYHGWQDWYIGSTSMNRGIPLEVQGLTHSFKYNDVDSLDQLFKKFKNEFAAVILEPMSFDYPNDQFLEKVKELTHKNNAILIFDEIITGFRFHIGGAQSLFGVKPDLALFGKSMGNGFPISAIVGKKEIMKEMENIFYSSTFAGEILSIVAARAVIKKMKNKNVIQKITNDGHKVKDKVSSLILNYHLEEYVELIGHPSWTLLNFKQNDKFNNWELKTFYLQEILKNGILTGGSHNICYSHNLNDFKHLFKVYEQFFCILQNIILKNKKLDDFLMAETLKPIFKVRN